MKYATDFRTELPLESWRSGRSLGAIGVSTITVAEPEYGEEKSRQKDRNRQALDQFLVPLAIQEFDEPAAAEYGRIRAELERHGAPIGAMDLLIAAHACSLDITLVTNNLRVFERVPGLRVVNWASG